MAAPAGGLSTAQAAAVAAHRFGLGEPALAGLGSDAPGWLLAQMGPADAQRGDNLATAADGLRSFAQFIQAQRRAREPQPQPQAQADMRSGEQQFVDHYRELVQADVRAQLLTAATTARPFAERLALFWANHFTVSMAKASARGLVGAFEREAIRPHIAGSFETLLKAAVTHAGMLRYLDNDGSAGPNSRVVQTLARRPLGADGAAPRLTGLNENLAREVLELHTLGVHGGYTQADVTALAALLTGWRCSVRPALALELPSDAATVRFDPAWHEPGPKTILGKAYPAGEQALDAAVHDLALHPSTAQFIATKLVRHFVADAPPPALVQRLARVYTSSGGDLSALYRELVLAPEAWQVGAVKLKTPVEFVVSTARLLSQGTQTFVRAPDGGAAALGQRVHAAPSPAGWGDRAEDWLGPDAVWKRVEWATRVAERTGRTVDARALAQASLGPRLSAETARAIERAADGPQALALLLLAPEFQRR